MLNGLNEKLEHILSDFFNDEEGTDWADVMTIITDSVAAGDCWQVPVDAIPEGMNETDYEEGSLLEKLPACVKKTIGNSRNEMLFCAFTSPEKVSVGNSEEPVMSLPYRAKDLLAEFADSETGDGFVINPWTDDFKLSREDVKKVLELAQKVPESRIREMRSYRIAPKAVIDTNQILAEWKGDWDDDDKQEKWELKNYPIMADGRVLLLFEMKDEVYAGKYDSFHAAHSISHYRVLEYCLEEGELRQIGKYRFQAQDAHIGSVYLYDGKLNATISVAGSEAYSVLPMVPTNDDGQFRIYGNIRTVITNSRQDVIVAYNKNLHDKYRLPLMVFSSDGEVAKRYHDEYALACSEVTLDSDENIWFHMYPSETVDVMDMKNDRIDSYPVALQGFDGMAISSDKSKLFLEFSEYEGGSAFYILSRDENGSFVKPIRFEFLPEMKDGKAKEISEYDIYGYGSTMKSWVILNADGKLYLYDIDDC